VVVASCSTAVESAAAAVAADSATAPCSMAVEFAAAASCSETVDFAAVDE
jgi:hypothetical protein